MDINIEQYTLPNILEHPYVVVPYIINNQNYYFQFSYSIRDEKVYLSIYILENEEVIYILKNKRLINNLEISKYIKNNKYWSGDLYLLPYNDNNYNQYLINSFSEDFYLSYRLGKIKSEELP